jgi:putative transposase
MPRGYLSSQTTVHFMNYHFVWCSKYRRKVIIARIEKRLKELIKEKARELCEIIALETMPDHIIQAPPTIAPNRIIAGIKGYTSKILRQEFPELKNRLPTLWTRSYFVSTHGHVSSETIKKVVEEQKC